MPELCLLYVSQYDSSLTEEISDILDACERNNPKHGITGLLCMNRKYFMQCLEGPRDGVSHTFARILHDKRHRNCELFACHEIEQRRFPHWSMGFAGDTENARSIISEYAVDGAFDPYRLRAEALLELMIDLGKNLHSQTPGIK